VNFCFNCGTKLSIGTEKFCPECGNKLEQMEAEDKDSHPSIDIKHTGGDVIGTGLTGSGNISGKKVGYTVNGNVINLHVNNMSSEVMEDLRNILSVQTQLPANDTTKGDYKKDITKLAQLQVTQQGITNVLDDVKKIEKKEGTKIETIKAGDLEISKNDLLLKEYLLKGNGHYFRTEYSEAIECYDKALEIDSEHTDAWFMKGEALRALSQFEQAIECYDKALEIDSEHTDAWFMKGDALRALSQFEQAIECYDRALKTDPIHAIFGYAYAWYGKGSAFSSLGQYEQAIDCYDRALEIKPNFPLAAISRKNLLNKFKKKKVSFRKN